MSRIYLDSGYLDIHGLLERGLPFNFAVGGRATGKTYGSLLESIQAPRTFLLIRRTQAQADIITKPEFSPFKRICEDQNLLITSSPVTKYNSAFYFYKVDEDGKQIQQGKPLGYSAALSTFSNIRGFDASDVDLMIFDEFIPERHERPIKNEFEALMNCYETVNRNRELQGKKPVQLLCLANANDVANPVFVGFNLVKTANAMLAKGKEVYQDNKRGICLYMLQHSPISDEKRNTVLYKATEGTRFSEMALDNKFSFNDFGNIRSRPIKEFIPICAISKICVYRHKSDGTYYVSLHKSGSPPCYTDSEADIQRFKRMYGWLWDAYMKNKVTFEEYLAEHYLTKYLK